MENQRKFVIGDIHGHFDPMMELFERVNFRFNEDSLISLGDLVDRGPKPIEVIETLMRIRHFIHILGNHDEWCHQYLITEEVEPIWIVQGGADTLRAYKKSPEVIKRHIEFFEKAKLYHIDAQTRLFVHGGFNPKVPFYLQKEHKSTLLWDRTLLEAAYKYHEANKTFNEFTEIFIGHTPTLYKGEAEPIHLANLWMLDTGVHQSGKLTLMDIESKEYWQA
jgi:serine/threonine protein phosphatase 1